VGAVRSSVSGIHGRRHRTRVRLPDRLHRYIRVFVCPRLSCTRDSGRPLRARVGAHRHAANAAAGTERQRGSGCRGHVASLADRVGDPSGAPFPGAWCTASNSRNDRSRWHENPRR
jgi:hypothetical protein